MEKLKSKCQELLEDQHFDALALGVLDFNSHSFEAFNLSNDFSIYDIASLTKPLTLGLAYLKDPKVFDENMLLLLDHQGGLPAWGRLSHSDWKKQLLSYEIKSSPTLYSDFSALRLMLEIEKKTGEPLYDTISSFHDFELKHWSELENPLMCAITGMRRNRLIQGEVHDDNAFVLKERVSHAGLFSTIDGTCNTLINLDKKLDLLKVIGESLNVNKKRFHYGWDSVEDCSNSLAGVGCSEKTFGHLGFTGTSIWIDVEKRKGHVILTNATKSYWYDRQGLNHLRRSIGQLVWN